MKKRVRFINAYSKFPEIAKPAILLFIVILCTHGNLHAQSIAWSPPAGPCAGVGIEQFANCPDGSIVAAANQNGVIRSTDDGLSWFHPGAAASYLRPWRITVGLNGDYYAAVSWGICKSTDRGVTWNTCLAKNGIPSFILAAGPDGSIYAVQWDSLFVSTNNGADWNFKSKTGVAAWTLTCGKHQEIFCEGEYSRPSISTDGGEHWFVPQTGYSKFDNYEYGWVIGYNSTSGRLFAAAQQMVYSSIDSGKHWTRVASFGIKTAPGRRYVMTVNSGDSVFVGWSSKMACIGAGATPVIAKFPFPGYLWNALVTSQGTLLLHSGSDGHIYVKTGSDLTASNFSIGGSAGLALAVGPDNSIYASSGTLYANSSETLFKLKSGEDHWSTAYNPTVTTPLFMTSGKALCINYDGKLGVSLDNGATWKKKSGPKVWGVTTWAKSPDGVIFLSAGGDQNDRPPSYIHSSTNEGGVWKKRFENNGSVIHKFIFDHHDRMYCAADGGILIWNLQTRTMTRTLQGINCTTIAFTTDSTLLAGTWNGMYRSVDTGKTWLPLVAGTEGIIINSLNAGAAGFVVAGVTSAGHGILTSTDNGATWTDNSAGLWEYDVHDVIIHPSGYLYAYTATQGVQRSAAPLFGMTAPQTGDAPTAGKEVPERFSLIQNYPNPFNPSTIICYTLPEEARVTLTVFNALGQQIATPVDGIESMGMKSVTWNASALASGIYYYRIDAASLDGKNNFRDTKKMILIR